MIEVDASLDHAPMGRDGGGQPMSWLRGHDEHHNQ
jgi:hypothetical protein